MEPHWRVITDDWSNVLRKSLSNNPYLQVLKFNDNEHSLPELDFNKSLTNPYAEELTIPVNTSDSKFTFVIDTIKRTPSINIVKWEGNPFGSRHIQKIGKLLNLRETLSFHIKT